jgi:hypothetical protein
MLCLQHESQKIWWAGDDNQQQTINKNKQANKRMEARAFNASHGAMRALAVACEALQLDYAVAVELVEFLKVKRHVLSVSPRDAEDMSPSTKMDELWHHVLLNSAMRETVDGITGGHVPHSTSPACLSELDKVRRRLFTMGLMERHATTRNSPDMSVWQAPGTIMADIDRIRVSVKHANGVNDTDVSAYLYVARIMDDEDKVELAVRELTRRGFLDADANVDETTGVLTASAVGVFDVHFATLTGKRSRVSVNVFDTLFELKYKIKDAWGVPADQLRIVHHGRQLTHGPTLASIGVRHDDTMTPSWQP